MSKTKPAPNIPWTIYRLKGTPARNLGRVYAPDQETAIKKAIEEFKISPAHQNKLIAQRS